MNETCSICKERMNVMGATPCNHIFCLFCIKKHLRIRNFCPSCFFSPLHVSMIEDVDIFENKDLGGTDAHSVPNNKKLQSIGKNLITSYATINFKSPENGCNISETEKNFSNEIGSDGISNKEKLKEFDNSSKFRKSKENKTRQPKVILFNKLSDVTLRKECKKRGLISRNRKEMIENIKEYDLLCEVEEKTNSPMSSYSVSRLINSGRLLNNSNKKDISKTIAKNFHEIIKIRNTIIKKNKLTFDKYIEKLLNFNIRFMFT